MDHLEGEGKPDVLQQASPAEAFRAEAVNLLHAKHPALMDTAATDVNSLKPMLPGVHLFAGSGTASKGGEGGLEQTQHTPNYTVKHGDNLWKIARENLPPNTSNASIADYVRQIEAGNPMPNPNLIMPGQIIKLPEYTPQTQHAAEHHHHSGHHSAEHHEHRNSIDLKIKISRQI